MSNKMPRFIAPRIYSIVTLRSRKHGENIPKVPRENFDTRLSYSAELASQNKIGAFLLYRDLESLLSLNFFWNDN